MIDCMKKRINICYRFHTKVSSFVIHKNHWEAIDRLSIKPNGFSPTVSLRGKRTILIKELFNCLHFSEIINYSQCNSIRRHVWSRRCQRIVVIRRVSYSCIRGCGASIATIFLNKEYLVWKGMREHKCYYICIFKWEEFI